ncbi:MAG: HAD family hydrolase [Microthrixaceae bacterium]
MTARRLILFDLDDTLSDRAGAFRNWARKWIARHGIGDPDALDWMCTNDDGGYRPRDLFFADAKERFALPQRASELARDYALTAHDDYHEDPVIVGELRSLVDRGARVGLVTNGAVGQQVKAEKLGIMPLLSCCVVSGLVGIRKPDPRIFALAVEAAGGPGPDVPWMVGDNADYDVGGAQSAGLRGMWISHGRDWDQAQPPPDAIAVDITSAMALLRGSFPD